MTRLEKVLSKYLTVNGTKGKGALVQATGKSDRQIDRYAKGQSTPPSSVAYTLALACGCSAEEALKIASECTSLGQRTA